MAIPVFMMAAQVAGMVGQGVQANREGRYHRQQARMAQQQIEALEPYERAYEENAALAINAVDQAYQNAEAGNKIEKSLLGLRMEQEGLAYTEASVYANEELRGVLSSQRAIFSARGADTGQGSARAIRNTTLGAFGEDERAREISKNFRNLMLQGQSVLYDIKSEANLINRSAGILGVQSSLLEKKANLQNQRANLRGVQGAANLAGGQVRANLFQNIMGNVAQMYGNRGGGNLQQGNPNKPAARGANLNAEQLNGLNGRR